MISVASTLFDLDASFLLHHREAIIITGSMDKRLSKTATLDGGVFLFDGGFSEGDRDFTIQVINPSMDFVDKLQYMIKTYSSFTIAIREGVFKGAIEDLTQNQARFVIALTIEEKLS